MFDIGSRHEISKFRSKIPASTLLKRQKTKEIEKTKDKRLKNKRQTISVYKIPFLPERFNKFSQKIDL